MMLRRFYTIDTKYQSLLLLSTRVLTYHTVQTVNFSRYNCLFPNLTLITKLLRSFPPPPPQEIPQRAGVRYILSPPTFLSGGIEHTLPPGYFAHLSNYDAAESLVSSFRGFGEVIQDLGGLTRSDSHHVRRHLLIQQVKTHTVPQTIRFQNSLLCL